MKGFGPKPFEFSKNQRKDVLRRLNGGETLVSLATRYSLSPKSLSNALVRLGLPSNIRSQIMERRYRNNKLLVLKRLSELPQVDKVLAEFGLANQKRRFIKDGIVLSETKEYLKAKIDLENGLTCKVCGVSLKNNRSYKYKLCVACGKAYWKKYMKARYHSDPEFRKRMLLYGAKRRAEKKKKG
ncbi:MAG TPA: hypothetical protein VK791_09975 [bacterium]|nr:hypothetical protein [bacterium]